MKLGKMKYRGTIAIDIDGVLADFEERFCEDFGTDRREEYSLFARYPDVDPDLIREYINTPEVYADLKPIWGGLLLCRQAHQRGWYVLLVTARDRKLKEVTKSWLSKYGVVYNELLFAKDKREALMDYDAINSSRKVSIVVDDSPAVVSSMPERFCVVWNQPWNYGIFPVMLYDGRDFKIKLQEGFGLPWRGIWDKVGDNEKN